MQNTAPTTLTGFASSVIHACCIVFLTDDKIDFTLISIIYQEYWDNMNTITVIVSMTADRFLTYFRGSSKQHRLSCNLSLTMVKNHFASFPFPSYFLDG